MPVLLLRAHEVAQRAPREHVVPEMDEGFRAVDEIAWPHEMVAAQLVVALGVAPWNGQARDDRSARALVLVNGEHRGAHAVEIDDAVGQPEWRLCPPIATRALRAVGGERALVRVHRHRARRTLPRLLERLCAVGRARANGMLVKA